MIDKVLDEYLTNKHEKTKIMNAINTVKEAQEKYPDVNFNELIGNHHNARGVTYEDSANNTMHIENATTVIKIDNSVVYTDSDGDYTSKKFKDK